VTDLLHFEDFSEGQSIPLGPYAVTRDGVLAFASEFDPQPFHLDDEAADQSVLGGLCASGWHSCAMMMRMMTDACLSHTAALGSSGIDEVRWLKPVRPGDVLTGEMVLLSKRVSSRRPDMGITTWRWEAANQAGEKKISMTGVVFMQVRGP
jgi:acyl dehydratase